MPLRHLHSADRLVYQRSGPDNGIPLIWLPGVHGCWTPLEKARSEFISAGIALVEVAYPLFDDWSLEHYATALENLLDALELDAVHLVGESFGSLVSWQFGLDRPSRVRSHLLVGGFCQAPRLRIAATAGLGLSLVWSPAFDTVVDAYVAWKGTRNETAEKPIGVKPYPAVRGARGQRATANRMRLIQTSDFRRNLPDIRFPVRYVGGENDRVVPVKREVCTLERELPDACGFDSALLPHAPHMISFSHPRETASRIVRWVGDIENARANQPPIITGNEALEKM